MNKKLLLSLMVFCFAVFGVARAQVTIGDLETAGNDTYLPMNSLYEYSYSQQIYTAEEIGTAGTINAITIWMYGNADLYEIPFDIYMVETDKVSFENTTDWVAVTSGDIVYSGSVTVHNTEAESYTFELDSPFSYSGTGNLVIAFDNNCGQWKGGLTGKVFTATDNVNRSIYARQDGTNYDPSNMSGVTASANPRAMRNVIEIDITSSGGPTCDRPATLVVSDITGYEATCTWESNVGNYTFEYKKAADDEWTVVTGLTTNTYALSNLESMTTYNTRVKAICGAGLESGYKTANFTTLEVCPDGMICIGQGTATNSYLPTYNYYKYSLTEQIYTAEEIGQAGAIESVDIFSVGSVTRDLEFYMVSTEKSTFDSVTDWIVATASDLVYSGSVAFAANSWNTISFADPFIYDGQSNVALIVRDMTGSYVTAINFYVFDAPSQAIRVYRDGSPYDLADPGTGTVMNVKNRLRLVIGEPPACPKPTGLAVDYQGGTEATISWTGNATSYEIDVNGNTYTTTNNSYNLTDLELATEYEVKVRANCGSNGYSEWTNAVSFTTDACMPEDKIVVNYALTDSYGDGWNNNAIIVVDENCTIVEMLTIESGSSASGTLGVCGSYVQFLWYAGTYPTETSWVFTDDAGNVLFEGAGNANMATLDVLYTIDNNPYSAPSDVAASEVGPHSAKLSWTETGTATAWQILLTTGDDEEEETIIDANSNPFVITGLTPETEYFAQVRATGANGTSIWTCLGADFTTTVACPRPSDLNVTAYPTSAEVAWNGFADAYDLEWALLPASESKDALWLQYDNGAYAGGIGNQTANTWTWGVMYPADMLDGNGMLSKVSIYETAQYNTADITINVYTGGDDAPATLVYTETITPEAGDAFHEIILAEPVMIDITQNLWITLTEYGTYVISYCSNGDNANNDWVLNGSTWAHVGDLSSSLAGDTWMIRGYVEPAYDPEELDWNPVSGITSPYTIEGLQPETTYVVRVKALCGGEDGESEWAMTTFTTPTACDMPINLAAEVTSNSATLNWTGYQESYNLRYRHTDVSDPFAPAIIILEAHDAWGDSTGYQMLLDADATAFGVEIPETGPYTGSDYSAFEYLIPENADCDSYSENIVLDGSVTLEIPAGVYDWCIVNPEPGGNMWIAGNGEIPSRNDDFMFEPGVTYHFTMQTGFGTGDGAVYEVIRPMSDWITVNDITEVPYTLTGLTPSTYYEWQIQGVNASCDELDWTEIQNFTTTQLTTVDQTIALSPGWNWFSANVEITLDDLKAALVAALPSANSIVIKAQSGANTTYNGSGWRGQLNNTNFNLSNRYNIKVFGACEIVLTGMAINPAELPITISNGVNWIAFPLNESMTVGNAFGTFPTNGDIIKAQDGSNAKYNNGSWRPNNFTLEPGQGYLYKSNGDGEPFFYPEVLKKAADKSVLNDNVLPRMDRKMSVEIKDLNLKSIDKKSVENVMPILLDLKNRKTVDLIFKK